MYLVPDLLKKDLKLVFCGTAPSTASAAAVAYYAKPGNQFWPTLHKTGLTKTLMKATDYPQLLELGIGLTDLCKTVSGNDDELPGHAIEPEEVRKKIRKYKPKILAFTSKHGASLFFGKRVEYGLQEEMMGGTRFFVLCSTSGRARRFFRLELWQELAELVSRV